MIPYGKQDINQADIDAIVEVLHSDFLTQGEQVPLFEKTVSNYCNSNYSVAVNSATSALHNACLAIGLGKDDWLWTSPNSFVASANCGLYCGARIDFVDINPQTYSLSVSELEKKLVKAQRENKLPKVLIPVHFAGQACNMTAIMRIAKKYKLSVVEDSAQTLGGKWKKKFAVFYILVVVSADFSAILEIDAWSWGWVRILAARPWNRMGRMIKFKIIKVPSVINDFF